MNMKVKIKKLVPEAVIPTYAKQGDAGMDLTAIDFQIRHDGIVVYRTGLAIEIPEGYVGLIFPRSSIHKMDLVLANSVGVIDSGYRGQIMIMMRQTKDTLPNIYGIGDRVAQLMTIPYPTIELEEVDELSDSERGEGGFGHTGK